MEGTLPLFFSRSPPFWKFILSIYRFLSGLKTYFPPLPPSGALSAGVSSSVLMGHLPFLSPTSGALGVQRGEKGAEQS